MDDDEWAQIVRERRIFVAMQEANDPALSTPEVRAAHIDLQERTADWVRRRDGLPIPSRPFSRRPPLAPQPSSMQVVWEDKPEPPRPPRPLLLDPDTLERARCAADGYSASEKAQYALRCKKLPQDAVSVILRRRRQIEEDNDLLCAIAGIREPDIVAALGAVIPWKIPSEEVSQM